jgi:2-oxoisovalerate dehydrogenase E1 component alpha subunit
MATLHGQAETRTEAEDRHSQLGLSAEDLKKMYYTMVLARALDERMWILNRQGKVNFVISGQGQEGAQIGSAWALIPDKDFYLPYYRDLTVVLAAGMTPREVMLALFARAEDPASGGRQMPGHYGHRKHNIVSGSSPIATQIPHAVGIAMASKIKGEDTVAAVWFGEAATSKGDFHEALNFAGVLKAPVVFICENNRYAISVPETKQSAVPNVAERARAYGFPGVITDGNDVLDVYRAASEAVRRARAGEGPTLIECKTYRIVPHSSDDDESRYRERVEVEEWRRKGPIDRMRGYLEAHGLWTEEYETQIRARAMEEVNDATEYAERAAAPSPATLLDHVFAKGAS